jgi:hypothetical protein
MLEALFELLFRVIKHAVSSGRLQGSSGSQDLLTRALQPPALTEHFPLLHVSLEALGQYTHLISVEYFTDLLEAFQKLLACPGLPLGLRMRCLMTVVEISRVQGDALNVDRRAFYMQLHAALTWVPLHGLQADDDSGRTHVDSAMVWIPFLRKPLGGSVVARVHVLKVLCS